MTPTEDENVDMTTNEEYDPSKTEIVVSSPKVVYGSTETGSNTDDDDYTTLQNTKPSLDSLLLVEIKRLVAISKEIQEKVNLSKTKAKKKYYLKKLQKNNGILANMLIRLEQYQQTKASKEADNG